MILIIGGNGALVNTILENINRSDQIVIAGRTRPEKLNIVDTFIKCDFTQKDQVIKLFQVHLTNQTLNCILFCISAKNSIQTHHLNVSILLNVVSFIGQTKFIYFSTLKTKTSNFSQNNQIDYPTSVFSWSKFYSENIVKNIVANYEVIRLGFVDSKNSIHYYHPILKINLIFKTISFGAEYNVKTISSAGLVATVQNSINKFTNKRELDLYDGSAKIIDLNKKFYPNFIWIAIPKKLSDQIIRLIYLRTPIMKFTDYASRVF